MVRPRKIKFVDFKPGVTYFKPRAVPLTEIEEVELTFDELESMRLVNIEKLSQEEAAKRMGVHQSTFQRTLARAREKITNALITGKAIKIKGGDYKMPGGDGTGPAGRGQAGFGRGMGLGRGMGAGAGRGMLQGAGGRCICPKCGHEQPHARGRPCAQIKCPNCGNMMTRKI